MKTKHEKITREFILFLDKDENLKKLVEKNIEIAKINNPDKITNPAQSLEELYEFLDWSVKCMPWEVLKNKNIAHFIRLWTKPPDIFGTF